MDPMGDSSMAHPRVDLPVQSHRAGVARSRATRSAEDGPIVAAAREVREHAHPRAWTAIRGFREILLIGAVYSLYDLTRFLVEGAHAAAFSHARSLLTWEADWHLDPEHALNKAFSAHGVLALPSDYIYATLHYVVTPVVLVWLWRRHSGSYSRARSTLMVATVLGLVGFSLLPVAPPRMLPGFIDTMSKYQHYGWWSGDASAPRGLGQDTNQFAALPSLHVGWALWCGWQLIVHGRHRITQVLGALYPIVLSIVVIATANHYLVDVVAGFVVIGVAALIVRGFASLAWRLWPRLASFSPLNSSPRAPV